jgi:polysaccharide pyruvyl transferase WcaK-like protein
MADRAEAAFDQVLEGLAGDRQLDVVRIENHLRSGRSADEIEEQYAGCDLILTTRLHGAILAARHAVPFIAIDQIKGGAKVASVLGRYSWPHVYPVDDLDPEQLLMVAESLIRSQNALVSVLQKEMRGGASRTLSALIAESRLVTSRSESR